MVPVIDSSTIRRMVERGVRYFRSRNPILVLGERGTGKTELASHLHRCAEPDAPFLAVSLGEIPEELRHAELFGHTRGAFTGSQGERRGLIAAAHGGTLFLDEIGLASPQVQGTLLGVIDGRGVRRVGEERVRRVQVRVIAATNSDLDAEATGGRFRQDLLDRFGYFRLHLPPLRERRDEIPPMFMSFLERECLRLARNTPSRIEGTVWRELLTAPWPGNIRQLRATAGYVAAVMDEGETTVRAWHLPPDPSSAPVEAPADQEGRPEDRLSRALAAAGGNKTEAARRLGLSRRHLYRLLARRAG